MKKTNKSLTNFARKELDAIHGYSTRYNKLLNKNHSLVLLELMAEHVDEIRQRHGKGDKHYLIETGDLLILCLELIKEAKCCPDVILSKCYGRYHKKLPMLIKNTSDRIKR
jgi:putative component of toxin-antitoxin plasmid stabilization module